MNILRSRHPITLLAAVFMLAGQPFAAAAAGAGDGAAAAPQGRITGGRNYELPDWFKQSFLAIRDDVHEARDAGRHVLVVMHLAQCPYCARLLDENFRSGETMQFLRENFDVIAINIRGSREVEWIDGQAYTEKQLARALKVYATPTMVFLDPEGKMVLKLGGYRTPPAFRQALDFVHGRSYRTQTLADFTEALGQDREYRMRSYPGAVEMTDFAGFTGPLALVFEDRSCADCDEFHDKVLIHADVRSELGRFTVVRLDARSSEPVVAFDGQRTTARDWARQLNVVYRPGIVLFNEGRERARMEGMQYRFLFKELLRYVSGRHYETYPELSQYNAARRDELLARGAVIDYSE